MKPVIVTCALTGGADISSRKNPAVPVSPAEIAASALEAAKAGAAIVHVHVRDPATTAPSMELAHYREVVERIRDANGDVILNLTTGAGGRFVPGADVPGTGGPGTVLNRQRSARGTSRRCDPRSAPSTSPR